MDELKAKIGRLRERYGTEDTMPPDISLDIFDELTEQVEVLWSANLTLAGKIAQLEKTAPEYKERS